MSKKRKKNPQQYTHKICDAYLASFKLIRWAKGKLPNTWTLIQCLLAIFIMRTLSVMGYCKENTRRKRISQILESKFCSVRPSDFSLCLWKRVAVFKYGNCLRAVRPAASAAKSLPSWPTLCDPIDGGPPGYPVPGILQARTLERVAISFSNAWKWKVKGKSLSRVRLLATPWTTAYQAPPSMGFSRQEYWSGLPCSVTQTPCIFTSSSVCVHAC